jgi:hypothetical protein
MLPRYVVCVGPRRTFVRFDTPEHPAVIGRGTNRLERLKALLHDQGHDTATARLMIFSTAGFHPELMAVAAQRTDVHLVDLPTLFGQSPPDTSPPDTSPLDGTRRTA